MANDNHHSHRYHHKFVQMKHVQEKKFLVIILTKQNKKKADNLQQPKKRCFTFTLFIVYSCVFP